VPNFNGLNCADRLCDTATSACVAIGGTGSSCSVDGDCTQGNCNDGICAFTGLAAPIAAHAPQAAPTPLLARTRGTASRVRTISPSLPAPLIDAPTAKCSGGFCVHSPNLGEACNNPELPDLPFTIQGPTRRAAMSKRSTTLTGIIACAPTLGGDNVSCGNDDTCGGPQADWYAASPQSPPARPEQTRAAHPPTSATSAPAYSAISTRASAPLAARPSPAAGGASNVASPASSEREVHLSPFSFALRKFR
jgi:hypothetical protein